MVDGGRTVRASIVDKLEEGDMGKFDHRDVDVFVGVDMAKQDHYAQATTTVGPR